MSILSKNAGVQGGFWLTSTNPCAILNMATKQQGGIVMFEIEKNLMAEVEEFVQEEYVSDLPVGTHFFGCMDCSNSCAENCAAKCKKNGK